MSEEDDVPALVDSSGEDDDSDMSEHDYPGDMLTNWFEQCEAALEDHMLVVKVKVMGPLLFGKVTWPDHWCRWARITRWLVNNRENSVTALSERELSVTEVVRSTVQTVLDFTDPNFDGSMMYTEGEMGEMINKLFELYRGWKDNVNIGEVKDAWKGSSLIRKWFSEAKEKKEDVLLASIFTCSIYLEHVIHATNAHDLARQHREQCQDNDKKAENLKSRGNELFKNGHFRKAMSEYTQAIKISPYNYKLYGNRAMAGLKAGDHRSALSDGLRAVTLKPDWVKGQYRYAEAYFELKEFKKAEAVNKEALRICKGDADVKDLENQQQKFKEASRVEVLLHDGKRTLERTSFYIKNETMKVSSLVALLFDQRAQNRVTSCEGFKEDPDQPARVGKPHPGSLGHSVPMTMTLHELCMEWGRRYLRVNIGARDLTENTRKISREYEDMPPLVDSSHSSSDTEDDDDDTDTEDEADRHFPIKKSTSYSNAELKKLLDKEKQQNEATKVKSKDQKKKGKSSKVTGVKNAKPDKGRRNTSQIDETALKNEFSATLRQGSEALLEKRSRNAVLSYQQVLTMIDNHSLQKFGMKDMEYTVLKYAMSYVYVDGGETKEILEAISLLNNIVANKSQDFPLAYFGLGRAYHRQNRYSEALPPVKRGLSLLEQKSSVEVLAWPGTISIIEETKPGQLKVALQRLLEICGNPPAPDARCRYSHCEGYFKLAIYVNDPDFQGYVKTKCYAKCIIEFHPECWKKVKSSSENKLSDKDILGGPCFTPDCKAVIIEIAMYDDKGFEKKKLKGEQPEKEKGPKKPRIKTAASSFRKIARKQERKEVRRQHRREARENAERDAMLRELEKVENEVTIGRGRSSSKCTEESDPKPLTSEADAMVMTVLKKEEEDMTYTTAKVQKNKTKKRKERPGKVVLNLGEFVGHQQDYVDDEDADGGALYRSTTPPVGGGGSSHSMAALDDFAEVRNYPLLDPERPFSVPSHLQTEVSTLESASRSSTPASHDSSRSQDLAERQKKISISENLFSYFADFLAEHGPLRKDSVILLRELEEFPPEACQVIQEAGGLANFLIQSLQFALVDDFVCRMNDAVIAKKLSDVEQLSLREQSVKDLARRSNTSGSERVGDKSEQRLASPALSDTSDSVLNKKVLLPTKNNYSFEETRGKDSYVERSLQISSSESNSGLSEQKSGGNLSINEESSAKQETEVKSPSKKKKSKKKKKSGNVSNTNSGNIEASSGNSVLVNDVNKDEIKEQFKQQVLAAAKEGHTDDLETVALDTTVPDDESTSVKIPPGFDSVKKRESMRKSRNAALCSLSMPSPPNENGYMDGGSGYSGDTDSELDRESLLSSSNFSTRSSLHSASSLNTRHQVPLSVPSNSIWSNDVAPAYETSAWSIPDPDKILSKNRTGLASNDSFFGSDILRGADSTASPEQETTTNPLAETVSLNTSNPAYFPSYDPLKFSNLAYLAPAASVFEKSSTLAGASGWPTNDMNGRDDLDNNSDIDDIDSDRFDERVYNKFTSSTNGDLKSQRSFVPEPIGSPFRGFSGGEPHQPINSNSENKSSPFNNKQQAKYSSYQISHQVETRNCAVQCDTQVTMVTVATETTEDYDPYKAQCAQLKLEYDRISEEKNEMARGMKQAVDQAMNMQKNSRAQISQLQQRLLQAEKQNKEHESVIQTLNKLHESDVKENQKLSSELRVYNQRLQDAESALSSLSEKDALIEDLNRNINSYRTLLDSEKAKNVETLHSVAERSSMDRVRAERAEMALLSLKRDFGNQILDRGLKDAEHYTTQCARHIKKIQDEHLQPVPQGLLTMYERWKATADTIKKTRTTTNAAFDDQINSVRSGTPLNALPELGIPRLPPPPEMVQMPGFSGMSQANTSSRPDVSHQRSTPTPPGGESNMQVYSNHTAALSSFDRDHASSATPSGSSMNHPPGFNVSSSSEKMNQAVNTAAVTGQRPKPSNSFEKIVETLGKMFPNHTRSELTYYIQQLRDSCSGSLSGMTLHDIVRRVAETILKDQQSKGPRSKNPSGSASKDNFQKSQAKWSSGGSAVRSAPVGGAGAASPAAEIFEEEEDPCIICHEELMPHDTCKLECQHRFHNQCIRKWFREQNTCPTCRIHALLPEDFPTL